jgi:hypothetical protein
MVMISLIFMVGFVRDEARLLVSQLLPAARHRRKPEADQRTH